MNISLKYRIALSIFILESIMVALVLWQTLAYSHKRIHEQLGNAESVTVDVISNLSHSALLTSEFGELQEYLEKLGEDPHYRTLFIINDKNRIVASNKLDKLGSKVGALNDTEHIHWQIKHIDNSLGRLGTVAIQFSDVELQMVIAQSRNLGIAIALAGMVVIAIIGVLMGYFLTRRLEQLGQVAKHYADGDLSESIEIKGHDEVSQLGNVLNNMGANLNAMLEKLRRSEWRYRTLFDDNPTMFFTVNKDGIILSVNHQGAMQLGYEKDQLQGESVLKLFIDDDKETAKKYLQTCFDNPDKVHSWNLRKKKKDDTVIWVRETARATSDINGRLTTLVVCEDITEIQSLSEQLTYQASHDSLTSLVNRSEFEIRLERALESARTHDYEHALCYLDLDQFKVINDTCGHIAGDELLRQISNVLSKVIRQRDTLARLGGDEFGVLMEHCSLPQAEKIAAKLHETIEDYRFTWEDKSFSIGVSIGLVSISETSGSTIELLKKADAACYAAKDAGRNRVHIYHEADTQLARRHGEMQWVTRINQALETNRFCLYAQPILAIDHEDNNINHYELLLRMKDDDQQMIPPGSFLIAAERYNLSSKIDRWVIDNAFGWLLEYEKNNNKTCRYSINLSAVSLNDREFLEFIVDKFSNVDISPSKICFEITESGVIRNLSGANIFINTLKGLGCKFALDDFGRGLSSFAYLKTLPVDYLKIDGLFIKDIENDPIDLAMVISINDIGKVMNKKIIAEYVETEGIFEKLRNIGVDYAQGHYIGRPRPIKELMPTPKENISLS